MKHINLIKALHRRHHLTQCCMLTLSRAESPEGNDINGCVFQAASQAWP